MGQETAVGGAGQGKSLLVDWKGAWLRNWDYFQVFFFVLFVQYVYRYVQNVIIGIIISLLFQSGFVFMSQISRNTYHIATQPTTEDVNNKRRTTIHRHTLRIMVFF